LLTQFEVLFGFEMWAPKSITEDLMNAPTSSSIAENPLSSDGDAAISRPVEKKVTKSRSQIEADAERIISSVARLTSNSINGLDVLSSELQQLQAFLKSEVGRVQDEIETALAGIKIILETIAPWKDKSLPTNARAFRAGPAANVESGQSRR
jgi:hypothetical protein